MVGHEEALEIAIRDFRQAQQGPRDVYALRALADQVGNILWEYGHLDDAAPWFLRVVDLLREIDPKRHNDAVAFALWKAGDLAAKESECQGTMEQRTEIVTALEERATRSRGEERQLRLAYHDLGVASLLLGNPVDTQRWGLKADEASAGRFEAEAALGGLGEGLARGSRETYVRSLLTLRGLLPEWPSFASNGNVEIYRFALVLAREHLGRIPPDLAAELLSQDGGEWRAASGTL